MVVWHLQEAQSVWDWLKLNDPNKAQELAKSLELSDDNQNQWAIIANKMWIPYNEEHQVLEQFENFFERLKPINLEDYTPRTTNMDWILGHEKTQTTRVIKQADVVMLMSLLWDELGDEDFLRRNWDLYSKIVDHGSSLSPSTHAWVAAKLGLTDEAYDLFIYSATIDLDDNKGNVRDGMHAAACGGIWQAVVFGFCGLELTAEGPKINPNLPPHWRKVEFTVQYQGKPKTFTITQES